ncbi:hypothetical protein Ancab_021955 [Ancistrocladus abbreviatus]
MADDLSLFVEAEAIKHGSLSSSATQFEGGLNAIDAEVPAAIAFDGVEHNQVLLMGDCGCFIELWSFNLGGHCCVRGTVVALSNALI